MKIRLNPDVFLKLEAAAVAVGNLEFSGFGFVNVKKENQETVFEVYDVALLDVGSVVFTEIPGERILPLLDRSDAGKMKLWFHRHPLGDSNPGPHNWSGTDEATATGMPLGGVPELVKWAIAIVRTPKTWIGRLDRFKDGKTQTLHLPVTYGADESFVNQALVLKQAYLAEMQELQIAQEKAQKERAVLARPFGRLQLRLNHAFSRFISAVQKRRR